MNIELIMTRKISNSQPFRRIYIAKLTTRSYFWLIIFNLISIFEILIIFSNTIHKIG
jgi:hypothetical protein